MDQILCTLYKRCHPKWSKIWNGELVGAPRAGEVERAFEDAEGRIEEIEMDME